MLETDLPFEVLQRVADLPDPTVQMFMGLRKIVDECLPITREYVWGGMPTYDYEGGFVRIIPFADHTNIESLALADRRSLFSGYKFTPKGMLQLYFDRPVPEDALREVFSAICRDSE